MQNKVIVCSIKQNLIEKTLRKIEESLIRKGLFDFSFLSCSCFEDCQSFCKDAKNSADKTIVICDNDKIDKLLDTIKENDDKFSFVEEHAVKLEKTTTFRNMLFVPIELSFDKFLDAFLDKREVHICSIFGKNFDFVKTKFDEIKNNFSGVFGYRIITNGQFLHNVYYSAHLDQNVLTTHFGESIFSQDGKTLQEKVVGKMLSQNMTMAIADNLTFAGIISKLSEDCEQISKVLKNVVVLNGDSSFEKLDISKEFLDEKGSVSKETVFEMAKNLLKKTEAEIALAITGFDCDAGRCFVAIVNKQDGFVFSSAFHGDRSERLENIIHFALFRLLKFLNEKY